jgi:hypothetical protein
MLMDDTPKLTKNLLYLLLGGVALPKSQPQLRNSLKLSKLFAHLFASLFAFPHNSYHGGVALRSTLFLLNPIFLQVS